MAEMNIVVAENNPKVTKKEFEGVPPPGSTTTSTSSSGKVDDIPTAWLTHFTNNNNNNALESAGIEIAINAKKHCECCEAAENVVVAKCNTTTADLACAGGTVDDRSGGGEPLQHNGTLATPLKNRLNNHTLPHTLAAAVAIVIPEPLAITPPDGGNFVAMGGSVGGATSLTPPPDGGGGGGGGVNSNRTSVNNSTENLSYSSDNYYDQLADDLILLDDDDDAEAEALSDDCVYAYRGDGADFDIGLDVIAGRGGDAGLGDDETDFLEMDFEPDPLSEIEYGAVEMEVAPHADAFLLQRDSCHLSGRHSANMSNSAAQRQLFSSPIDDLPPPKALQSQAALLSRNFACITLHLDQIKGGGGGGIGDACLNDDRIEFERASVLGVSGEGVNVGVAKIPTITAHSLPNTLHGSFGRDVHEKPEKQKSPSKVTGAKPKRLSTFSTSSSTSSKSSVKSRTLQLVRSDLLSASDETCLDCLEKEFLANTIGKVMDPNECPKCRKRSGSNSLLYKRAEREASCRSGSPAFFIESNDERPLFEPVSGGEFLSTRNKRSTYGSPAKFNNKFEIDDLRKDRLGAGADFGEPELDLEAILGGGGAQTCYNFNGKLLPLKSLLLPAEPESVTISTLNFNTDALVQALDKLQIAYNARILEKHFTVENSSVEFQSLMQLLLHESKRNCNHPKLKRLIELATMERVNVEFEKDTNVTEIELIPVKVADILHQWTHTKNLELLKQLDKRFADANVLGKIANIIRQAQQHGTPRRVLPEFISIPQYYPSGYLILSKKC